MDKRSRRPNQPQQPQPMQRGSPHKRSRNPLESAAQRRMSEADVRDAEVREGQSRNLKRGGKFKFPKSSNAADELSRGPGGDAEDGEQAEGAAEAVVAVGHAVRLSDFRESNHKI